MKIKKITIKDYRQFINTTINFEKDITILAGANNCGKTSLVELFKAIFNNRSCGIEKDDIPIKKLKKIKNELFLIFKKGLDKKNESPKDDIISKIINLIENEIKYTLISVEIEISYKKDEDISKFADYLMDLDSSKTSFFFNYKFKLNQNSLFRLIKNSYLEIKERLDEENEDNENLKEILFDMYFNSLEEKYYYTNRNYNILEEMDKSEFKKLYNFKYLNANRNLDDEKVDKKYLLSKGMIDFISNDEKGSKIIENLPIDLKKPIIESGIKERIQKSSLKYLSEEISDISKTNGGREEEIILDIDIELTAIKSLLKNITKAKYKVNEYYLSESAQGLGYSNLIYIHLQLEKFIREFDKKIVNLFIIEEPEAHMHPQMQKVFIKYLFESYNDNEIQGLVTSHSSDLVKETELEKLRVIREIELFDNEIYDMNLFLNKNIDEELKRFYNLLFNINFSNIIFSDKIIMYEGDTERMFIQSVLEFDEFEDLSNQYIAFVQVGGAYAHKYKKLIEYLGIKTLIITDIDYGKKCSAKSEVLKDTTTNAAIKDFYKDENEESNPTIDKIFEWKKEKYKSHKAKRNNSLIRIEFQDEEDFYARTFEEAMLSKYFGINIGEKRSNNSWKEKREKNNLKFSIPNQGNEFNVREIVDSTSNSKTNFIYSVIINDLVEEMLPSYIKEGLKWLEK